MDGVIIVNKPKNITSRDAVNFASNILNIKKVGHTGTLDPIATGVLVLCVGKATKLVDVLTCYNKEYIATVKLGILTDTLDICGKIVKKNNITLKKDKLVNTLNSFIGTYEQEVPIYSAVKIHGKKLCEYARNNETVKLPKRNVTISKIKLLSFSDSEYSFSVTVSKGTYIRSLIKDINDKLGIIGVMSDLKRIRQGDFSIRDSCTLEELKSSDYRLLSIKDILNKNNFVTISEEEYKNIKNGAIISNKYDKDEVVFIYKDEVIAIYKVYQKDSSKMKPYKMFI